jgi:hypothetical protein
MRGAPIASGGVPIAPEPVPIALDAVPIARRGVPIASDGIPIAIRVVGAVPYDCLQFARFDLQWLREATQ